MTMLPFSILARPSLHLLVLQHCGLESLDIPTMRYAVTLNNVILNFIELLCIFLHCSQSAQPDYHSQPLTLGQ